MNVGTFLADFIPNTIELYENINQIQSQCDILAIELRETKEVVSILENERDEVLFVFLFTCLCLHVCLFY